MNNLIPFSELSPSADTIRNCGWREVLNRLPDRAFLNYSTAFFVAAQEASEAGDAESEQALAVLGAACSMYYDENDAQEPLKPMVVTANGRTAALSDFESQHLDPLSEVLLELDDLPLRARISDLLWIRRREPAAARVAASDYLDLAKASIDPENWVESYEALRRAAQIATLLGKTSVERAAVAGYATELLEKVGGTDPLYLTFRLVGLLNETKLAAPGELFPYLEASARKAEDRGDWMRAADYWGAASNLRTKSGDVEGGQEDLRTAGRAKVQVGESMADNIGLASEHWLERGYQSLRQGQAPKEELAALQQRLQELQRERAGKMPSIKSEVPLPVELIAALDRVKGLDLLSALEAWAFWVTINPKEALRESIDEQRKTYLFASLFSTNKVSESGKTEIIIPALPMSGEPDPAVLNLHMWHRANLLLQSSAWFTEYVRRIIGEEHAFAEESFADLLEDNPFVEPGREAIFAKGLMFAVKGDYLTAAHLLSPQIENSIRHLLGQSGVPTTFMKQDGTQEEYPLTKIVWMEEFEKLFGEDLAFFLQGLLAHKAGSNLRNRIAHGLMSEGAFYSPESVILGPLVIRLLIACKRIQEKQNVESE